MKKSIALILTCALAACGTRGTINGDLLTKPIPAKESRLVIERDNSLLYLAGATNVALDGQRIASLARGAKVIHDVPAGKHFLTVDAPGTAGNYTASFETKAGKTYTFLIGPNESKSMLPGMMLGTIGESIDAQVKANTGYFQIKPTGVR